MDLERLTAELKRYAPQANVELVQRAYQAAAEAHAGQTRASGEPYILHPLGVALILAELEMDVTSISAALLHDVVEDTSVSLAALKEQFGEEIATIVDGVTKLGRLDFRSKEEHQAENFRKMFMAMAKDMRVILIKLADRLHNMRTLKYLPEPKQKEIARETMDIFAPLAHRLGISHIKWELEDLSFRFLQPQAYYEVAERLAKKRKEREAVIEAAVDAIHLRLEEEHIAAEIQGRPKHIYSIYRKMVDQNKDFSQIYDIMAIRVVVKTVRECYDVLGVVHATWKPLPGRFKDYIAVPKSNMYQSLHTTIVTEAGEPLEIQIRTTEMHRTAEYGIAAHWRYKEQGKSSTDRQPSDKLNWLRQLLDWQQDMRDAHEYMESLRIALFDDEVFVFTPKGDVIDLPARSTPIDFAYRVHTDVGHRCVGAKINGKIVPLTYQMQNGDIVEIITSKQAAGPSRDWLNIVKTSTAKNRIRAWFKRANRDESIAKGEELLEKEFRKEGYQLNDILKSLDHVDWLKRFNLTSVQDLFAAVGYAEMSPITVTSALLDEYRKRQPAVPEAPTPVTVTDRNRQQEEKAGRGIEVEGVKDLLVRFSRCCNPIPGDEIVGYITRGRGVSVHRRDCPNVTSHLAEGERLVHVAWGSRPIGSYPVSIELTGLDRSGLLAEIIKLLSDAKTNIYHLNGRATHNKIAVVDMTLEIRDTEHLQFILERMRRMRDIYSVERVTPRGSGH